MDYDVVIYSSPIGIIRCLFEGRFLIGISIKEARGLKYTTRRFPPVAFRLFKEFDEYFNGSLKKFEQEIKFVSGTKFERQVWLVLREIPYGETRSYKWLANRIGSPKAIRAVGQALKKNPLPIILPCHRIISSDGSISGFSYGVGIKKWLLTHEGFIKREGY